MRFWDLGGVRMSVRSLNVHLGWSVAVLALVGVVNCAPAHGAPPPVVAAGKKIALIAGCNDCHTAGFAQRGGHVPQEHWLTGSSRGWHGPWGTTYAPNLRLFMAHETLKAWIHFARNVKLRPPMPYWALRHMSKHQLTALYRFIRYLGPAGKPAPVYLPPGVKPKPPYVTLVLPQKPKRKG